MKLDTFARPGAVVSGKVTFSDGKLAEWYSIKPVVSVWFRRKPVTALLPPIYNNSKPCWM